jgi:uncharacterized protein (DUF2164 family)
MSKTKHSWDFLSDDQKKTAISNIIDFFATERDQEIGIIAAEEILDFFLQTIGTDIYNKGIKDTKSFTQDRLNEMLFEMDVSLKK